MIESLMNAYSLHGNSIICNRAKAVDIDKQGLRDYASWQNIRDMYGPSNSIFFTTGGGTLFPPSVFSSDVDNTDSIRNFCFDADDVWLNIHARISGVQIVKSNYYEEIIPVSLKRKDSLFIRNINMGGNDRQLRDMIELYNLKSNHFWT